MDALHHLFDHRSIHVKPAQVVDRTSVLELDRETDLEEIADVLGDDHRLGVDRYALRPLFAGEFRYELR